MKAKLTSWALGICVWAFGFAAVAQQPLTPQQQLQVSARAFIKTFNRGDAPELALFWTKDGDYINEAGQRFEGRKAIENEYANFFAANPGAKLTLSIDSIRLLNDNIAIEDGRAAISPLPKSPPAHSRYTAVHVKIDNQWLMSNLRDTRIDVPSNYSRLSDLDFLAGTWQAENHGASLQLECRWITNKSFLERNYTVTENSHPVTSSREIIGWDPQAQVIKSWTFSSDGGHALGVWSPHERGWVIETAGVLADGTPTSATYILSHVDDNTMAWKSVRRSRGDVQLPDTQEIVLKRKPAEK